ncbi:MAG: sugar ABC transporter permease [Ardenticatenaceae bacterium]|nr:sugar ABC transporter permease [Ardenticatenaceae bacterium]
MNKVLSNRFAIFVFLGPALLLYTVILLIPIGWALGFTAFKGSPISGFEFAGFDNYIRLIGDKAVRDAFWFGLKYAAVVSGGQVLLGLILSLIYVFYLKSGTAWIRTLIFFPVVLPTVAVAQIFSKLFAIAPQYGLVNSLLAAIGLESFVQAWLGQGDTAFWVIVIMDIWRAMGFYAILLYAGVIDIPTELIEAARIDGASDYQIARKVIIPLLRPVLVSAIVFSLNGTLKVFDTILALTNGGPGTATSPLTVYFYKVAFSFSQYGYGSTIAVLLTLMSLVVTLLVLGLSRRAEY